MIDWAQASETFWARVGRHVKPPLNHGAEEHCPQGHAYDEANTYRPARGDRQCKTCRRIRERVRQRAIAAVREKW